MADTKEIITCPACDCEMTKIYMPEAGINIDICLDGCGGILFDNRELEKFNKSENDINEVLKVIEGKEFKAVEEAEVRICPICQTAMVKNGASTNNVEIDVCNVCGAKFLDNGELQKIRAPKEEQEKYLGELMNALYTDNLKDVVGKNAEKQIKSSPRRQFFEDLVNRYLMR